MKEAAYEENYRESILKQALAIYDTKVDEEKNNTRPLYRPKDWQKEERSKKKKDKKRDWSTKGGHIAPIFIPSTPRGELARRMKKVVENEKKAGINFKIVEMGGKKMKR